MKGSFNPPKGSWPWLRATALKAVLQLKRSPCFWALGPSFYAFLPFPLPLVVWYKWPCMDTLPGALTRRGQSWLQMSNSITLDLIMFKDLIYLYICVWLCGHQIFQSESYSDCEQPDSRELNSSLLKEWPRVLNYWPSPALSSPLCLMIWDRVSHWTLSSPFRLDWLASELPGSTCFCPLPPTHPLQH